MRKTGIETEEYTEYGLVLDDPETPGYIYWTKHHPLEFKPDKTMWGEWRILYILERQVKIVTQTEVSEPVMAPPERQPRKTAEQVW